MSNALRRIMFYLRRKYYKFTKWGIVSSICSHVLFLISVIAIFLQQDKWHGILDALFYIWLIGIFALLIVYAIGIYGGLLFGEKKFIKNDSLQSAKAKIVEFGESEIITETEVALWV